MITSTANKKVKQIVQWQTKAKERKKDGVFLAEGRKMFEEAPPSLVCEVYLSEEFFEKNIKKHELLSGDSPENQGKTLSEKLTRTGYELVAGDVFAKMSDT